MTTSTKQHALTPLLLLLIGAFRVNGISPHVENLIVQNQADITIEVLDNLRVVVKKNVNKEQYKQGVKVLGQQMAYFTRLTEQKPTEFSINCACSIARPRCCVPDIEIPPLPDPDIPIPDMSCDFQRSACDADAVTCAIYVLSVRPFVHSGLKCANKEYAHDLTHGTTMNMTCMC